MTQRRIAFGDVHGCARALEVLLRAINPQPDDIIIPLGDYVDRGPGSREVLDQLVALIDRCTVIPILGNHDLMMRDAFTNPKVFEFWVACGGDATLTSYGGDLENVPVEHRVFLQGLQKYHETENHIFVHANYDPDLDLEQTPDLLLFWEHLTNGHPRPHKSGKTAVVGHTPQAGGKILNLGFVVCLDTYCFGGGWLTALDIDSGKVWQSNEFGELRIGQL